jgi:hypothetical protein
MVKKELVSKGETEPQNKYLMTILVNLRLRRGDKYKEYFDMGFEALADSGKGNQMFKGNLSFDIPRLIAQVLVIDKIKHKISILKQLHKVTEGGICAHPECIEKGTCFYGYEYPEARGTNLVYVASTDEFFEITVNERGKKCAARMSVKELMATKFWIFEEYNDRKITEQQKYLLLLKELIKGAGEKYLKLYEETYKLGNLEKFIEGVMIDCEVDDSVSSEMNLPGLYRQEKGKIVSGVDKSTEGSVSVFHWTQS